MYNTIGNAHATQIGYPVLQIISGVICSKGVDIDQISLWKAEHIYANWGKWTDYQEVSMFVTQSKSSHDYL